MLVPSSVFVLGVGAIGYNSTIVFCPGPKSIICFVSTKSSAQLSIGLTVTENKSKIDQGPIFSYHFCE